MSGLQELLVHMEMQSVFLYVHLQLHTNKVVTTTSATEPAGQTVISVTDASVFNVGDIVNFGETGNIEYETTATSTTDSTITIKLLDDVNAQVYKTQFHLEQTSEEDGDFMTCLMVLHTSSYATERGRGTGDELHIVVYDYTGEQLFDVDSNGQRTNAVLEVYANLSKNINAKSPQGDASLYYPYVIRKQSSFVYWTDHNTAGINWGTDIDAVVGSIVLNQTDSSGSDAGDNVQLEDGTPSGGGNLAMETGTGSYSALNTPTKSELSGGTDDYAVTAGEIESGYGEFEDTESIDINLVIGGRGGGFGDSASTQDTHVTMLTTLVEKEEIVLHLYLHIVLQQLVYQVQIHKQVML